MMGGVVPDTRVCRPEIKKKAVPEYHFRDSLHCGVTYTGQTRSPAAFSARLRMIGIA